MTAPNEPGAPDESAPPARLTFPPHLRIRSGLDFERIYAAKQKASDAVLLVFGAENGLDHPRIGLSVSRRHGNSVARHRLRRLLREAFRLEQHRLPRGIDFILIPGRESGQATQQMFRDSLVRQAQRLAARIRR